MEPMPTPWAGISYLEPKAPIKFSFDALDPGHFPELCYLSSFMAEPHPFSCCFHTVYCTSKIPADCLELSEMFSCTEGMSGVQIYTLLVPHILLCGRKSMK